MYIFIYLITLMKYKKFSTDLKCKKALENLNLKQFSCSSCGGNTFYKAKNLDKVCMTCKKRTSPTKDTIFENVRFGIVKAFEFAIYCHSNNYEKSSIELATKFGLTQKTAWHFKNKLVNNKYQIENLITTKEKETSDIRKLEDYLNKQNALMNKLKS